MNTNGRQATLHRLTVENYRAGQAQHWKACFIAGYLVGRYEKGETLALASDLCRSVDTVERMAIAAITYRALNRFRDVSALRRSLSWSHFVALGEEWKRYEFSPDEAIGYLRDAEEARAGVRSMRSAIRGIHDGNGKPKPRVWEAVLIKAERTNTGYRWTLLASGLHADDDAPPDGAALQIREVIE